MKLTIYIDSHIAGVFRHISLLEVCDTALMFFCDFRYVTVPRVGRSFLIEGEL